LRAKKEGKHRDETKPHAVVLEQPVQEETTWGGEDGVGFYETPPGRPTEAEKDNLKGKKQPRIGKQMRPRSGNAKQRKLRGPTGGGLATQAKYGGKQKVNLLPRE